MDIKNSQIYRLDFFGPKMVLAITRTIDFVPGPFRILEMAPFSDFQELNS